MPPASLRVVEDEHLTGPLLVDAVASASVPKPSSTSDAPLVDHHFTGPLPIVSFLDLPDDGHYLSGPPWDSTWVSDPSRTLAAPVVSDEDLTGPSSANAVASASTSTSAEGLPVSDDDHYPGPPWDSTWVSEPSCTLAAPVVSDEYLTGPSSANAVASASTSTSAERPPVSDDDHYPGPPWDSTWVSDPSYTWAAPVVSDEDLSIYPTRPSMVRALYNFKPTEAAELAFGRGDIIKVVDSNDKYWWKGQIRGHIGIFPAHYVVSAPHLKKNPF
jgi:hypothetical protein